MAESGQNIELLTVKEVSTILKLSESGLRNLVRQGKIPHIKFGKRTIRFNPKAIEAWLDSFFEIGGQKNVTCEETTVQGVGLPVSGKRQNLESIDRGNPQEKGRGKGSRTEAIGRVAQKAARRFADS